MVLSLLLALPSVAEAAPPGCYPDEPVVFACETAGGKWLAVCAGPQAPSSVWAQYRFGPSGKPEFTYPTDTAVGFTPFKLTTTPFASGESTTFSFTTDGTTFEVYQSVGSGAAGNNAGVNVSQGGKVIRNVPCTGEVHVDWSIVAEQLAPGSTMIGAPGSVPDPLSNKGIKEICENDALLLLRYPYQDLASGGFARECCAENALGPDEPRCNLDWPVNDVPMCKHFDVLRNTMYAYYGYPFQKAEWASMFGKEGWYVRRDDFQASWMPKVAQDNAAILKAKVEKKDGCMTE